MCILIVKPQGAKVPPLQTLKKCALRNNHGFGYATAQDEYKTLDFNEFAVKVREIKDEEAAIIHLRYATHGSICTANCHPFRDRATGVAFAHNGVLSIIAARDKTDSETAFRSLFVPKIEQYGLFSSALTQSVNRVIGASKFAFIDREGNIKTFGRFVEFDGCYYSNYQFLA